MKDNTQLQEDLKKYGIIKEDNSFSDKLTNEDVNKFFAGHIIVADNDKTRVTFQLVDNNSRLKVEAFERSKGLNELLENSKKEIQYSDVKSVFVPEKNTAELQKKAFVFDEKNNQITEYDLVKDSEKLTQIIAERKNFEESTRYRVELQKLKDFLLEKIDKFPEVAKEITNDLNIVSKTINRVNDTTPNESQAEEQKKSNVQLNVNDPDLYQDANREREEEQERERKRGFRR